MAGCVGSHSAVISQPVTSISLGPRGNANVLQRALSGVVLLLNKKPDGKMVYGAGVLLPNGMAVTNLHVVDGSNNLSALLFDGARTSYSPLDGGLARYIFENENKLVAVRLLRTDKTLDLALIRIEANTDEYYKIPFRKSRIAQGETVMALGHPQEAVWSFTTGVVSALHSGMVQTDAAINTGNSGGPLIDEQGELVGINTSRLFGTAQGISFARPVEIVQSLVEKNDGRATPLGLDRRTPEQANQTCWRALELGSPNFHECIDGVSELTLQTEVLNEAARRIALGPRALAQASIQLLPHSPQEAALASAEEALSDMRGDTPDTLNAMAKTLDSSSNSPGLEAIRHALKMGKESAPQFNTDFADALQKRTGIKLDKTNPAALSELLRMGNRVQRAHQFYDNACLEIEGRNADGTLWLASSFWVKREDGWREVQVPNRHLTRQCPTTFAPFMNEYDRVFEALVRKQLLRLIPLTEVLFVN
jgi:hypothetical protein